MSRAKAAQQAKAAPPSLPKPAPSPPPLKPPSLDGKKRAGVQFAAAQEEEEEEEEYTAPSAAEVN